MPVNRSILQPKWTFTKKLSCSAERIKSVLLNVKEGSFTNASAPFLVMGTGEGEIEKKEDGFVLKYKDGHQVFLFVDHEKNYIAIKGEWWYCGIYTVLPAEKGSELKLEVFNVAHKYRWAAGLLELTRKKKHRTGFDKLVLMLEERCGRS